MKKAGLCWQGTGVRWDVVRDPPAAMLSMVWKPGQETAALGEGTSGGPRGSRRDLGDSSSPN